MPEWSHITAQGAPSSCGGGIHHGRIERYARRPHRQRRRCRWRDRRRRRHHRGGNQRDRHGHRTRPARDRKDLRNPRSPRRDRRHLGPVPLSRDPLGLGRADFLLRIQAVDRRHDDRAGRGNSRLCARSGARIRRRGQDPIPPQGHRRELGLGDPELGGNLRGHRRRRSPAHRDRARDVAVQRQRLLPLRQGQQPRASGTRGLRRRDHPPAILAGGVRLQRKEDRRIGLGSDRGDAHPLARRQGRICDDAATHAHLHVPAAARISTGQAAAKAVRRRTRAPHHACHPHRIPGHPVRDTAPLPGVRPQVHRSLRQAVPAQGLPDGPELHPALQPVGPAPMRGP